MKYSRGAHKHVNTRAPRMVQTALLQLHLVVCFFFTPQQLKYMTIKETHDLPSQHLSLSIYKH